MLPSNQRSLAQALAWAREVLANSGVPSPRVDAALMAGHLLGMGRGEVEAQAILGRGEPAGFQELVQQRADRVPLQHLTGSAPFRWLELAVGPGVFVPRPETELLVDLTLVEARRWRESGIPHPLVADLGTGSGAIALAVATEDPETCVVAVEKHLQAWQWAKRNLSGSAVTLLHADFATVDHPQAGEFCVVVSNPPYVPPEELPVDPDVRDYDPPTALYGGADHGMEIPGLVMDAAVRLLRPGGAFFMEHAESQVREVAQALEERGFSDIRLHQDLTGRPRATEAHKPQ